MVTRGRGETIEKVQRLNERVASVVSERTVMFLDRDREAWSRMNLSGRAGGFL